MDADMPEQPLDTAKHSLDTTEYPLDTLTDLQLREYRRELEHSLKVISPDAPVRSLLARKLFEVLGEQASRTSPESGDSELPENEEIVSKS